MSSVSSVCSYTVPYVVRSTIGLLSDSYASCLPFVTCNSPRIREIPEASLHYMYLYGPVARILLGLSVLHQRGGYYSDAVDSSEIAAALILL